MLKEYILEVFDEPSTANTYINQKAMKGYLLHSVSQTCHPHWDYQNSTVFSYLVVMEKPLP